MAVFVCALWQGGWTFESLTYNPLVGPPQAALMQLGALTSDSVTASHQWWRLVSTVFVDAGGQAAGWAFAGGCWRRLQHIRADPKKYCHV